MKQARTRSVELSAGLMRKRVTDLLAENLEDVSSTDIFVHHSAIQMNGFKMLNEGDEVEFVVKAGPKGAFAVNVRKFR